jgi:hypothetical protein
VAELGLDQVDRMAFRGELGGVRVTRVPAARIATLRSATAGWLGTNHLLIAGKLAPITAVARLSVKLLDALAAVEAPGAGDAEIKRAEAVEQSVSAAVKKAGALQFRPATS